MDKTYRNSVGETLKKSIITVEQFNNDFQHLIITNKNIRNFKDVLIDYVQIKNTPFESQHYFLEDLNLFLLVNFKFYSFLIFPLRTIKFLPLFFIKHYKLFFNKIKNCY